MSILTRSRSLVLPLFAVTTLLPGMGCKARNFNNRPASGVLGIYGEDDRREMSEAPERWQALGRSVALVPSSGFRLNPEGDVTLKIRPLQNVMRLCDGARFARQPSLGKGTAFLLSNTLVLTASHVVSQCKGTVFLFDQRLETLKEQDTGNYVVPKESVFSCAEIIAQARRSSVDFSLVRLDRPATGREPFRFELAAPPAKDTRIVLFGHPSGLPLKFANNAKILSDDNIATFKSDLDAFEGNSGGPVASESTGALLGVLTSGNIDYVATGSGCQEVAKNTSNLGETAMSLGLAVPYFGEALVELGLAKAKDFDIDLSTVDFSAENASLERAFDVPDTAAVVGFDLVLDGTRESGMFCLHSKLTPPGTTEKRAEWRNAALDTLASDGTPRANATFVLSSQFDFPHDVYGKASPGTWKVTLARECKGLEMSLRKLTLRLYLKK